MAVREKQFNSTATGIAIDLSFMSKSKLKSALSKFGNLFRLGKLRGNTDYDTNKFDAEKAREIQMANYNNVANMAHLYSRRF